jgi:hypothetical protein
MSLSLTRETLSAHPCKTREGRAGMFRSGTGVEPWTSQLIASTLAREGSSMFRRILCLVRAHAWGALEGDASGGFQVCARCGKKKFLSGGQARNVGYHNF